MTKERKRQLAFILADIVGCNEQKAEEIIDTTELGRRLQYHDTTILYEQQTENMYRLAEELREGPYANFADKITNDKILASIRKFRERERKKSKVSIIARPELIQKENHFFKQKEKMMLQSKSQNRVNIRRIENADKFKR